MRVVVLILVAAVGVPPSRLAFAEPAGASETVPRRPTNRPLYGVAHAVAGGDLHAVWPMSGLKGGETGWGFAFTAGYEIPVEHWRVVPELRFGLGWFPGVAPSRRGLQELDASGGLRVEWGEGVRMAAFGHAGVGTFVGVQTQNTGWRGDVGGAVEWDADDILSVGLMAAAVRYFPQHADVGDLERRTWLETGVRCSLRF